MIWKYGDKSVDIASLDWPEKLRDAVSEYGAETVWHTGLKALGYPPTWAVGMKEFSQIYTELEKRNES